MGNPDVIIIPGTKNTIVDLQWLKRTGLADRIHYTLHVTHHTTLIGICGGYQMLGESIRDAHEMESKEKEIDGLGLLPIATTLERGKTLTQVTAKEAETGLEVSGYEIHHGRTISLKPSRHVFKVTGTGKQDGARSINGNIWGTYIHGVFDETAFRRNFLNRVRAKKGLGSIKGRTSRNLDKELDKLAGLLRNALDIKYIYNLIASTSVIDLAE